MNGNEESSLSSNQSSVQDVNGNFEPLDCNGNEDSDNDEDNDVLPVDYASIEREEEEFLNIAEGSPADQLSKKILERLGKPCNRGKSPSEYTDGKTFWVSTSCPSFALGGNKAPKPEVLYTPRMFLWFPQYLTATGKKLNCCKSGCDGHLNVKGFTPKARRVIDIKE